MENHHVYSLVICHMAIEAMAIESSSVFQCKMVMFNSYVKLPEGNLLLFAMEYRSFIVFGGILFAD